MNRLLLIGICLFLAAFCLGCSPQAQQAQVVTTTLPVYEFTAALCSGTDISVSRLITQEVSCLHDYSLQSQQMRAIEGAELVVISGGGLEDFLGDVLHQKNVIDASAEISFHHGHSHDGHDHEHDPHIWLDPQDAKIMVQTIAQGLTETYPQHSELIQKNAQKLLTELETLYAYGTAQLSDLQCRELVTFHDGFSYLAEAFDLTILHAVEEESGSEASAKDLIGIINIVRAHQLPSIFTERNGSNSAARIISDETGAAIYPLDMAMSGNSYFEAMYHNIDTIKEALG